VTDDAVIVMSRVYEAPRDLVWEAITQPRHVAQWWGGPGQGSELGLTAVYGLRWC
jgi:uncharacterized protein YndB with AHSA1/START domain